MKTVALLGGGGYIGSAMTREINRRQWKLINISYKNWYRSLQEIQGFPDIVINCAAFIPPESVSECNKHKEETIDGNVVLPALLANYCYTKGYIFAQISTACLWGDGDDHDERDKPQHSWSDHAGFYIGTKVMAERYAAMCPDHYVWRVRLPFDNFDCPRNYLSKLISFDEIWDHQNTIVNRHDFAKGCLDLVETEAPYGTYHVLNPGAVGAVEVLKLLHEAGIRKTMPRIVSGPLAGASVNCGKLAAAGVFMRSGIDAVKDAIDNWMTVKDI